ncbi:Very-long-chain 3-oxoacyl-CoA reductase-like protein [Sesamum alatum]|uniref:Very-long-chain 3-oxoacyl-CoA reductase-like protein n=1 Tax=Sesamum alatum TaxID=300844 RepID=A0AAE1YGA0_9LAMI|nr:Very-long-chain 3-oxoacyl-CoA reductase-like protein [Sesamum alatum]
MLSTCLDYLKAQPLWIILISSLGFLSFVKHSTILLKWIFNTLLRPSKDLKNYGSWALITGSTDGIGRAFAFKLAKKGLNLVLVSRNGDKLKRVSSEIQETYPEVEIRVFELDFAGEDAVSRVRGVKEAIKDLDVGVLINNVGVTYPRAMYFHEVDEKIWMKLVRVNVEGTSYVTRAIVLGMVARGRGAIVNIGSGASIVVPSHPLYAVYAAQKQYKRHGIDVQCQVPLYVSTRMAAHVAFVEKPSLFIPSPDKYVDAAIRFVGRGPRCTPYWAHSLQWLAASMLPDALLDAWRLSIGLRRIKLTRS